MRELIIFFFPQSEEWCQQYNFEWKSEKYCSLFSGRIKKRKKKDAVKFKLTMCAVFAVIFENIFMQMNSIIQSLLKRNITQLEFSHIFVLCGTVYSLFVNMNSLPLCTKDEPRIYDVLCMWRLLLLLTMNDRLILVSGRVFVWIFALKRASYLWYAHLLLVEKKKKKILYSSTVTFSLLWNALSMW